MNIYGVRMIYYTHYCTFTYKYTSKPEEYYNIYVSTRLQKSITNIMKHAFPEIVNNKTIAFNTIAVTDNMNPYFKIKKWKIFVKSGYVVRITKS